MTKTELRSSQKDLFALASLIILATYFGLRFVNFDISPFEDAAMLMRYAEHLAQGLGIVWNAGEPPLDGATDFLFMVIVALAHRLGLSMEVAVRSISIASHMATVLVIYIGMRHVQSAGVWAAFLSALYFAAGPGLFLAAAYFGTPVFVLGVACSWLLGQRLLNPATRSALAYAGFSLACLLTSLIRPEGVLISLFMMVAIAIQLPRPEVRRLIKLSGGLFAVLGGVYFLWRWNYFGHPLPNPFYKKGGGSLYFGSMRASIRSSVSLGLPLLPVFLLIFWSRQNLRTNLAFVLPIVGTTLIWVLLSDEMNFADRFQYPVLALFLLSWYPVARNLATELNIPDSSSLNRMQKAALGLVILFVAFLAFDRQISKSREATYHRDGRYDVAVMLSRYADRGYTIATTEAGLLPYYSKWRAIDTWGLNDRWIAENGEITVEYLDQQRPDIVMWHEFFSPLSPPPLERAADDPWFRQVMTLQRYVDQGGFVLAAVYGVKPTHTHYYYVRSDLPERDEIVAAIRSMEYRWSANGETGVNFAFADGKAE